MASNNAANWANENQNFEENSNQNQNPQITSGRPRRAEDLSPHELAGIRYGKCKWFNVTKGWGFLTPNDGGHEVFVHQSVIRMAGFRSLAEQEDVEFECRFTIRGLEATSVSGENGRDCMGSTFHPRGKKRRRRIRCYNCGKFANHIAAECNLPRCCHRCKQYDHLLVDCPLRVIPVTPLMPITELP